MRKIHLARDPESAFLRHLPNQFLAPLRPPIRREHWVLRHRSIGMKTDPIIGEDRIGFDGLRCIGADDDLHADIRQRRGECVELQQCGALRKSRIALAILEGVRSSRLHIETEARRTDHQHGRRRLCLPAHPGCAVTRICSRCETTAPPGFSSVTANNLA